MPVKTAESFQPQKQTGISWFSDNPLDGLTNDQLKERLMVAETIMKQQYTRNKELERMLSPD